MVAGRHRRQPLGAVIQGTALSTLVLGVVLVEAIVDRLVLNRKLDIGFFALAAGSAMGAIVVASIGGMIGRWLYIRSVKKKRASL
jgi:succinate-acetate transporter protein